MSEVTRPPNSLASRLSAKPRRPAKVVQPPSEDRNEAISPDRMEIHESSAGNRERSNESPDGSRSSSLTLEDEEVVRKAELEECMTLHEEGMGASRPEEATSNRDNEEEEDDDDEEEDEKKERTERRSSDRGRKREKVWEGAPEFQWRRVESKEESCQLIMDNLALSDLNSPFLYQTLCRAKHIQLSFTNSTRDGSFEHSIFRQGRVTARFHSDTQAMAQAVNGLVFLRTPPNRPRLKVLLPQTSQTDSMSGLLEMKLGRVLEPHLKSRQLLVRDVDPEAGVDLLRDVAARTERLEKAELVTDVVGRRCGLLTYQTPADAIQAHLAADSIPAGTHNRHRRRRYVKVFFMEGRARMSRRATVACRRQCGSSRSS